MDEYGIKRLLLGSKLPTRMQLRSVSRSEREDKFRVQVYRTMPVEFVADLIPAFASLWDADVEFAVSDYDSSLAQLDDTGADVYLVWMDWRLYFASLTPDAAAGWIGERLKWLSQRAKKPVLVNNWPENLEIGETLFSPESGLRAWVRSFNDRLAAAQKELPGCHILDLAFLSHQACFRFYDLRNDEMSSYPFGNEATMLIARHIGLQLLPAMLSPRIKAVVLDLDDTLYSGVLGEDGAEGVRLTEGHKQLQKALVRLKQSGIMLALCSRNEEEDVRRLFETRRDFPLKWSDFSVTAINWNPKSDNVARIAEKMNISLQDCLYIDDNISMLEEVKAAWPRVKTILAQEDAGETLAMLEWFPGLYQLRQDALQHLRTEDIQANQLREEMRRQAGSPHEYLASLGMRIRLHVNNAGHAARVYDLSRKTNQFNLSLKRYSEVQVEEYVRDDRSVVVTVELSDRLSDSGIIGAMICTLDEDWANLTEMAFSCRGLGRMVETVSFRFLLKLLQEQGIRELKVDVVEGPRNRPALDWYRNLCEVENGFVPIKPLIDKLDVMLDHFPAAVEEIYS